MSAWRVSKEHIDVLITAAVNRRSDRQLRVHHAGLVTQVTHENADSLGRLLWLENHRSVSYRYPDDDDASLPGPVGLTVAGIMDYTYQRKELPASHVASLLVSYEYQTSEHPEWPESFAFAFCQALTKALLRYLPGYDEAPWSV